MGYSADWAYDQYLLGDVEEPNEDLVICNRAIKGSIFYCQRLCNHGEPHQKTKKCDNIHIWCPFSHGGMCIPI